jgi:uncharacterized membrane protein
MHDVMKYLHILSAFALVAGAGAAHMISLRLRCAKNTAVLAALASLRSLVARAVLMPAAALTILLGIGLSHMLGYSLLSPWLLLSLVATLVMVLAGMMIASPSIRKIRARAQELQSQGVTETDELKPLAALLGAYAWCDFVVTALIIYLMVMKPGS